MNDLDKINSSFEQKIKSLKTKEELQILKTEFFGKRVKLLINLKILERYP